MFGSDSRRDEEEAMRTRLVKAKNNGKVSRFGRGMKAVGEVCALRHRTHVNQLKQVEILTQSN